LSLFLSYYLSFCPYSFLLFCLNQTFTKFEREINMIVLINI
jgi:hypothetical protein